MVDLRLSLTENACQYAVLPPRAADTVLLKNMHDAIKQRYQHTGSYHI